MRYSRFTFAENTITNLPKVVKAKFLGSDGLCFSTICKFGNFKNPFATITSLSVLYLSFRRLFCWYKRKKWFLGTMAAAQEDECRWVRFEMILTMRGIYINFNLNLLTKFTWSSRSTKFKNILQWNISQMITKTIPISTKIATRVIPHQNGAKFLRFQHDPSHNLTKVSQVVTTYKIRQPWKIQLNILYGSGQITLQN